MPRSCWPTTLSDIDFIELEAWALKGASLTEEERVAYEKNHFERTVGVGLDPELIQMNGDGRLIERIAALAETFLSLSIPKDFDNLLSRRSIERGTADEARDAGRGVVEGCGANHAEASTPTSPYRSTRWRASSRSAAITAL